MKRKYQISIILFLVFGIWYAFALSSQLFDKPYSTVVFAQNGDLLGARISKDGQWRFPLSDSLPEKARKCLLYKEDRYFYYHPGFNPVSLARALWQDVSNGKIISGASTITMQVIRLSRNNPPRTVPEKIYEILLAIRLELGYSKKKILNMYASHAPFGGNVVGFEAASWRYFKRRPSELSWAECATLAVLPNAPGLIHPGRNRKMLLKKRNDLLLILKNNNEIDEETYKLSLLERIPDEPSPLPDRAPHLTAFLNQNGAGKKHYTTIDTYWQKQAQEIVNEHVAELSANRIYNGALLMIDNNTGQVKAYVGNVNSVKKDHEEFNDMLRAPRSSGSILKPFLYASMLTSGDLLPTQLVPDIPTFLGGFKPENFINDFDGAVPADEALARSLNIPTVLELKEYTVDRFLKRLHQLDFSTINNSARNYGLSLILGGAEVTAWDLGRAYYHMAAELNNYDLSSQGKSWAVSDISVETISKKLEKLPLNSGAIYRAFDVMTTVNRPRSEMGWQKFGRKDIAWKTGTSFGFRDAWAVGVTPKYTCVVWVGNASGEGRPGLIGAQAAGPVLFDFMNKLPTAKWFGKPYNEMQQVEICKKSGMLASRNCPDSEKMWIPSDAHPSKVCSYHHIIHTTADGKFQVSQACALTTEMISQKWFVLPPEEAWYYAKKHADYKALPPWKPGCGEESKPLVQVIYPKENGEIFIPKELNGEGGKVIIEVACQQPDQKIYWHLNGNYIGETQTFHQMALNLPKGDYDLYVENTAGDGVERHFSVVNKED